MYNRKKTTEDASNETLSTVITAPLCSGSRLLKRKRERTMAHPPSERDTKPNKNKLSVSVENAIIRVPARASSDPIDAVYFGP